MTYETRKKWGGYIPHRNELSHAARYEISKKNFLDFKDIDSDLPRQFSWQNNDNKNYMTPIQDQGNCGSCVAFAVVAAAEARLRILKKAPYEINGIKNNSFSSRTLFKLSEAELFFCSQREAFDGQNRCSSGWNFYDALTACQERGLIPSVDYPYPDDPKEETCSIKNHTLDLKTKVKKFHSIRTILEMKKWLVENGPLITSISFNKLGITEFENFFDKPENNKAVFHEQRNDDGHAICVVGYDDGERAWICKNSWKDDWADNGYFKIGYGECGIDAEMWAIDSFEDTGQLTFTDLVSTSWGKQKYERALYLLGKDGNVYGYYNASLEPNVDKNAFTQLGCPEKDDLSIKLKSITAQSFDDCIVNIFAVGENGKLYQLQFKDNKWHEWLEEGCLAENFEANLVSSIRVNQHEGAIFLNVKSRGKDYYSEIHEYKWTDGGLDNKPTKIVYNDAGRDCKMENLFSYVDRSQSDNLRKYIYTSSGTDRFFPKQNHATLTGSYTYWDWLQEPEYSHFSKVITFNPIDSYILTRYLAISTDGTCYSRNYVPYDWESWYKAYLNPSIKLSNISSFSHENAGIYFLDENNNIYLADIQGDQINLKSKTIDVLRWDKNDFSD